MRVRRRPHRSRRLTVTWGLAVALSVALPLALATGRTVNADTGSREYVALGDSYTAGPFIPWMRLDPLGCGRSTHNYPSELADAMGIDHVTDVSCSGASTADMTHPQAVPFGINPPQLDALSAGTDLVTVGIGGNNGGVFGDIVTTCPALRPQDPRGAPCRDHFTADGIDLLEQRIALAEPKVEDTLVAIHARAPHARVLMVGYPRIAPATKTCPDVLPFADGDYAYLASVERALNGALAKAAADVGAVYVDTFGPSAGHDACGSGGIPWVNGRDFRPLAAAPYHPNAAGMAGMASILVDVLAGREPDVARAELAGRTAAFETRITGSYEPGAPAGVATRTDTARLARGYGER